MLQMCEPNLCERFSRRSSVTTAHVSVCHDNSEHAAQHTMGDSTEQVTAMAICDAILWQNFLVLPAEELIKDGCQKKSASSAMHC